MGKLTTHVLDTANGRPAKGVRIELFMNGGGAGWKLIAEAVTNADGRVDGPILEGSAFAAGVYEMIFHVGDYFQLGGAPDFLNQVPVRFGISDAAEHYHVPLLISPFGYSTYRGS